MQSGPDAFEKSRSIITFWTISGVIETLCSFRLVLDGEKGKEILDSSRLTFLGKFSANNFALSDADDNTSELLNRGGIADLPLLRKLLPICQTSWEPKFWEVINSFVLLVYASLAASWSFLQRSLVCLNFTLDSEDLSFVTNQKSDFYELWLQHKQLKTMDMSEAWPDTFDEGHKRQFQPKPTHKIH